ncbi:flagellar hook-basal body complex protein FliE [Sphingomonas gellani]|uniref:Flagellar hook-basal body complex protein FliE n=1 Tax=Sphingomonas gellani TaxID=1166340 RepID=A0A1H8CM24_9SPHN|nr:flagellar hook-basal body complex protein FliE [Sphingomonas gellani]SEM95127.1 flagellar hook-basal body complex protein FliE [Sphingomonas gellani]
MTAAIGGAMGIDRVMQLRQQILDRNAALSRAGAAAPAGNVSAPDQAKPANFADSLSDALKTVNDGQNQASKLSEAYERGETVDIAKVMLARQQASVGFEATLQVRNKLLSAYKDIMSMPV